MEIVDFLKLFGGFVYLLLGGDLLVRGALGFARESKIPPTVVGLTIVALGTSAPELMVSVFSALSGHPAIAIGNVIGSNIANILLVLGVPVLIHPIICDQIGLNKQASLMLAVSLLFIILCMFSPIGFWQGILLIFILLSFLVMTSRGAGLMPLDDAAEELERVLGLPGYKSTIGLFIFLGIIALPVGASLVIKGAVGLASGWGVSEAVIGLSLIALGTSLPELSTTVIAAFHKSSDVALGNIIGSNLFNILAIIGFTALITDIPVDPLFMRFDLWIMLAVAFGLWVLILCKIKITPTGGIALLTAYLAYLYAIF